MKNIKQIQHISKAYMKQRESVLYDISRLNLLINSKMEMLKKILAYQDEYTNGSHLEMSRSVPTLNRNLNTFTNKIKNIIQHEQDEIEKLRKTLTMRLQTIYEFDQKINVMKYLESKARHEVALKIERTEQMLFDDLTSIKFSRGDYE